LIQKKQTQTHIYSPIFIPVGLSDSHFVFVPLYFDFRHFCMTRYSETTIQTADANCRCTGKITLVKMRHFFVFCSYIGRPEQVVGQGSDTTAMPKVLRLRDWSSGVLCLQREVIWFCMS
jgi:hypothetical protein